MWQCLKIGTLTEISYQNDILKSQIQRFKEFPFSRTFDMLNTYMRDHINLDYGFTLINKETWGNVYKPSKKYQSHYLNIDPVDLRNSPDYTLLIWCKSKRLYGQNTL